MYAGETEEDSPTCTGRRAEFGCTQLTDVSVSQGMDPVVRQVGQHIEMEPEWEAAFTLQMKLTNIITMIQDWCSTDVSGLSWDKCCRLFEEIYNNKLFITNMKL